MKFTHIVALAALVNTADAAVGAPCTTLSQCASGECCGMAVPASGSAATSSVHICQWNMAMTWTDPSNSKLTYNFNCDALPGQVATATGVKAANSGVTLQASAAVALAAALYLY